MKHAGRARQAGLRIIVMSLVMVVAIVAVWSWLAGKVMTGAAWGLGGVWFLFLIFSLSFFRDPEPEVPAGDGVVVSPAHGTVDVIDETNEETFMGGRCRRVSVFLSVFDVHIQNAPVSGQVRYLKHRPGQFGNAMRRDCGSYNENVLIGIETKDLGGARVGVRLIAGLLARRIVPWVTEGEMVLKGERTSLIQFGSRVDLYLPLTTRIQVKLGEKVKGGESVIARCS
jgi:phosphatidylserine decarboxylase